jgi:hypothetical protein
MLAVGDPYPVNRSLKAQRARKCSWLTSKGTPGRRHCRGRGPHNLVWDSIGLAHVIRSGARHVAVRRLFGLYLLSDDFGDRGTARSEGTVVQPHSRGTSAPHALGNDLNLVGDGIMLSHLVGGGAGNLSVAGLVIDTLDASDGHGRAVSRSGGGLLALGSVCEVVV